MALDEGRRTRSYLFGRLLAVAENIESFALDQTNETRDTSAEVHAAFRRSSIPDLAAIKEPEAIRERLRSRSQPSVSL